MNILIFNCGSSSLKYKIIKMPEELELLKGEAQRIGPKSFLSSRIVNYYNGKKEIIIENMNNHFEAYQQIIKVFKNFSNLKYDVIGHRIVHGGSYFSKSIIVDSNILKQLDKTKKLAPIHNPPAIEIIYNCKKTTPDIPQILVFDTAFHSSIPDYAYYYGIPLKLQKKYQIRKYGFHGTSHYFVAKEAAKYLDINFNNFNAVSCHLGSGGASLCAIKNGKSIDNTMGYSPLQGLIMSTRSGDLDPGITLKLLSINNYDSNDLEKLLNKKSGIIGLSGKTSDIRDLLPRKINKNIDFQSISQILQTYIWRIKKYLGAYLTAVSPVKSIIFTDTIGEEVPEIRELICENMGFFGIHINKKMNKMKKNYPLEISDQRSKVKVLIIKTNEELEIARNCYSLVNKNKKV